MSKPVNELFAESRSAAGSGIQRSGDEYFGPNYGQATVYTNVRKDYLKECSNVGKLLQNIEFTLAMENPLMDAVLNQNQKPRVAAKAWLVGVSGRGGEDGMKVASARLAP
jgi:glycine betaine/proline transport system substrate-binding protein